MKGGIQYFVVYPNGGYTTDADWNNLQKDPQAWFYLKRICTASYSYANHYETISLIRQRVNHLLISGISKC